MGAAAAVRVGTVGSPAILRAPLDDRRRLLDRVAEVGLDHVFVADHVSFHDGTGMDGLINAATLLAAHPTLRVQVGVYLLALRHPVPVARQLATLCESAPGRLELGVGVGGEDRHEIEVCEVDPRTRGQRTDESLALLRRLLSGEPVTHTGKFFRVTDALIRPAPDPAVPLVVGGRSSAAVRRAGLLGDGWLGAWVSPERFRRVVAETAQMAADAGRLAVKWRHGLQLWCAPDREPAPARARLAAAMERLYRVPFDRFERYSPCGPPEVIAEFLIPYARAGCRHFNVMPVAATDEDGIEALGEIAQLVRRAVE